MSAKSKARRLMLCCIGVSAHVLSAEKEVATPAGLLDGTSLIWLSDPETVGLEFKNDWKFFKPQKSQPDIGQLTLGADVLAGYRYHPKLHANASAGYSLRRVSKWSMPAAGGFNNEARYYPYTVEADAAIESAPTKPATGDSLDWQRANTNASITTTFAVPHTDRLSEWVGKITDSDQAANALFIDGHAAYVDQRVETAAQKNGFRGTAGANYALPLFFNTELYGNYRYTWGQAVGGGSKHYYSVQLSRYFKTGKVAELFSAVTGKKEQPRLFVRYFEGGVAPTYTRTHGWEFGIGTSTF